MEITLEKIELVRDRTGVTYKEAKEALEKSGGNVVDAIIAIEETVDTMESKTAKAKKDALIQRMKEIVAKGNVSKIVVTKGEDTLLNIPLNVGILGTVIAPWGMIAGVVAAFGFRCKIEFIKDDGTSIDISERAGGLYDTAKEKGADLYSDIKEKAPGVYSDLVEKGGEALNKAKDVAFKAKNKVVRNDFAEDFDINDVQDAEEVVSEETEDVASEAERAEAEAEGKEEQK
ncbi:MAG: DUF4342 domain-containing protein [Eubacterium sp.]|nr:DUF4342 domain-containing protein [Eubacterium sp.]